MKSEDLVQAFDDLQRENLERKRAEEGYRSVIENLDYVVFRLDAQGIITYASPAVEPLAGYKPHEVIGQSFTQFTYAQDIPGLHASFLRLLAGQAEPYEFRVVGKDGTIRWVRSSSRAQLEQEQIVGIAGILADITERKRTQEALFNSRQMLRSVLDNIPQRVFWKDRNSTYLGCSKPFALDCGYQDPNELVGKSDYETASAAIADLYRADDREVMETGRPKLHYEESQIKPDGSQAWLITSKVPMYDKDGQVIGVLGTYEDITEHKRDAEERIRLATAIEQLAEAVFIADTNWTIRYVNPAFEHMTGYEKHEIIGQRASILNSDKHDAAFYRQVRETLSGGEVWSGRLIDKKKDGTLCQAEVTASPVRDSSGAIINYVAIRRDITHEVRLERELRQAQKMEAIGTLAGGIAHDFNNLLSVIIGYTEMVRYALPEESPAQRSLQQVLDASARATDLVKQILTFSRRTEQEKKPVQVAVSIAEALNLLRPSLPATIEICREISLPPGRTVVWADPTEIHQVLMNLCTNAAHAMRATGGILSIGLSEMVADRFLASQHPDLQVGPYVCLTVSDTGHGMDAAVMERIFDPYFTTKRVGEGTGLGLSIVQAIVRSCGGAVSVYSETGKGTTFNVYLPRIEEPAPAQVETQEVVPTGTERILFIDDEKVLVELGQEMLKPLGYSVATKTSSLEALETFRADPYAFDLVITDMTMPGLTGRELAEELMAIRSDLPIILCTGFNELINEKQAWELGISEFVMKPYAASSLAKTIRKVLQKKSNP